MANSELVTLLKSKIIDGILEDEIFYTVIDPDKNKAENIYDLPDQYIFRYNKNPETIKDVPTFITITVSTICHDYKRTFTTPTISVYIYSHCDHMTFTKADRDLLFTSPDPNNPKKLIRNEHYYDCRNDYLSMLLDEKFNGKNLAGFGTLKLTNNTEGNATSDFLYRCLVFETIDLNNSVCNGTEVNF